VRNEIEKRTKYNLKYELAKIKQRGGWQLMQIIPLLPTARQKIPLIFHGKLKFFAYFKIVIHLFVYLFIYLPTPGSETLLQIKGKVCSITSHEGPLRKYSYSRTLCLTSTLERCGWLMPYPGHFNPRKETWHPLYRRLEALGVSLDR
jgi:hypothetical protein